MFLSVSDATIELIYHGAATDGGEMDVRDLAPALLAFGDACQQANRVLNGSDVEMTVRVKADFQTGSFEIHLDLFQKILRSTVDLLTGHHRRSATDILTALGFFGLSVPGALQVWQMLKGRPPRNITVLGDRNVLIEMHDNSSLTVGPDVAAVVNDGGIRSSLPQVFAPLARDGFTHVEARDEKKQVTASVENGDFQSLSTAAPLTGQLADQVVNDVTAEAILEVVRPVVSSSFQNRYVWTFTDGRTPYSVRIDDREFLDRLERGEISFTAHDQLKVLLHTQQLRSPEGRLKTEQRVVRVLETFRASPRGRQAALPSIPDDATEKKK